MVSTSSSGRGVGSIILKLAAGLVLAVVLFLGVTALLNTYNYADGTRTGLMKWEIPRLCRGGSRSLTFPGVCPGYLLLKLGIVSRRSACM